MALLLCFLLTSKSSTTNKGTKARNNIHENEGISQGTLNNIPEMIESINSVFLPIRKSKLEIIYNSRKCFLFSCPVKYKINFSGSQSSPTSLINQYRFS